MVNKKRLTDEFCELVRIDSLSLNERKMADVLKSKLEGLGLEVYEDDAGQKAGGNAGNLISVLKGDSAIPPVLLMAHMDTVVPGIGKNPIVEGDIIRSDGKTILGADDAAGIECILETVRILKEGGMKHGDVEIVFTIAEEIGLLGSKYLDYSKISAKMGFIMDSGGEVGRVSIKGPAQNKIDVIVNGKAAHAGVSPEKGINAIKIAAQAVSEMKLGRIDEETTANVGIINGGSATNIVCDRVEIKAEARSRNEQKLEEQTKHMMECFNKAVQKLGGSVDFKVSPMYPAFNVSAEDCIISILKDASAETGVAVTLEETGGGSDTNIISGKGIKAVNLSVGMEKVHSVEEYVNIDGMARAVELLTAAIRAVENIKQASC